MTDPAPAVTPLGYAGLYTPPRLPPAWRTDPLRAVLFLWGVPLAVGTAAFAVGMFALLSFGRNDTFGVCVVTGMITMVVGAFLTIAGGSLVVVFAAMRWAPAAGDRWPLVARPALLALALLDSNFAVAYGYFLVVVSTVRL